jgi:ABC-2 type transport system permease protein
MLLEIIYLIFVDALFLALCLLFLLPLSFYRKAAFAVLKRNFVGYFMNPTGYIFLCLFVLLTSLAAFWPHGFFNANLANLNQLNKFLPYIMLIFIPAITMSLWADERRQGTDELLLTLPADDFDIVVGKYCAAASIYTCSLVFSQLSHYAVLVALTYGLLDQGLLCATYFGYWLTGLAMIAIGMIASFWTKNLTVGFILGVLFNAPLAFAANADTIIPYESVSRIVKSWSVSAMFDDFGRGVVSLSSVVYFVGIIVVGLYISIILIATRHWFGGKDSMARIGHYLTRIAAMVVTFGGLTYFFTNHDFRLDATEEQVSSLSPDTIEILKNLDPSHPIEIEAFISRDVPESHVQTRHNLVTMLHEFASYSKNIRVLIHDDLQPFSEQTHLAEERYRITPRSLQSRSRGVLKSEDVIMGAAFNCGMERVVVPFFEYGIPVEYELIRSINTVQKASRPLLGILRTDARIFGDPIITAQGLQPMQRELFITELQKQYDVDIVNPAIPIEQNKYAALLVVQPSSLDPVGMQNLIDAVRSGQPTAIFEDPLPAEMAQVVTATGDQRVPAVPQMGIPVKADIRNLWDALGIDSPGALSGAGGFQPNIAWQFFNPYAGVREMSVPPQVFVSANAPGTEEAINQSDPITKGLTEIYFPFPGTIEKKAGNRVTELIPLARTGNVSGTITATALREIYMRAGDNTRQLNDLFGQALGTPDKRSHTIAARIVSSRVGGKAATTKRQDTDTDQAPPALDKAINVVYVADVDFLASIFLFLRARPGDIAQDEQVNFRFENVAFLLNIVDDLTGDDEYISIRRHTPRYYTLQKIEDEVERARNRELQQRNQFMEEYERATAEAADKIAESQKVIEQKLRDLELKDGVDIGRQRDLEYLRKTQEIVAANRQQRVEQKLARKRDEAIKEIRREADLDILAIQNRFKVYAAVIPPIPPLIVGLLVFVRRRLREREGISRERLL